MLSGLLQRQAAGSVFIEGDSRCTEILSFSTTQEVDTVGESHSIWTSHRQKKHEAVSVQS